jgi:hypothetical protein
MYGENYYWKDEGYPPPIPPIPPIPPASPPIDIMMYSIAQALQLLWLKNDTILSDEREVTVYDEETGEQTVRLRRENCAGGVLAMAKAAQTLQEQTKLVITSGVIGGSIPGPVVGILPDSGLKFLP